MPYTRLKELLSNCVEYIAQNAGSDAYDVLTNVVGFTETELDNLVNDNDDDEDDD